MAIDNLRRAKRVQVLAFCHAPGGGDHPVTQPGKNRDGKTADAAIGTGHQHVAVVGRQAVFFQGNHAEHGRVACRAYGHRLRWRKSVRQGDQPFAFQPGLLRQTAPMPFTHAPAIEQHLVAHLELGRIAGFDHTRQVDARHHWKAAHNRALTGDRQRVLIVERAVRHAYRHVTWRQLRLVDIGQFDAVTGFTLVDQNALEHVRLQFRLIVFK